MDTRQEIIRSLQSQLLRGVKPAACEPVAHGLFSSIPGLAALCPLSHGSGGLLVEWLSSGRGSGCEMLALLVAREALKGGGKLVVCDGAGDFFAGSLVGWGMTLERLILLRPQNRKDLFWACEQALRCRGVSVLLCEFDGLTSNEFRRLQLSAEEGGTVGLLLRPLATEREPSWAAVRFKVEGQTSPAGTAPSRAMRDGQPEKNAVQGRRVHLKILRSRGGRSEGALLLEIDHAAGVVRLVSELAHSKTVARSAGD